MIIRPSILIATLALVACAAPNPDAEVADGSISDRPDQTGPLVSDPAPDRDGVLRVLVYHDMEGLAGQELVWTAASWMVDYYPTGRQMLTADVNAVIGGLFAGGADEVHVTDAHGSGSPEPDLLLDELDERAEMIFRDEPYRPYVDLTEPDRYDAVAVVGMHAKPRSLGFIAHTFTIGSTFIVNGMSITETEVIGYSWGRVDVPVIFASGDNRLEEDLRTMPWIEFVRVKDATDAFTAVARPVEEAHADLRAAAQRALENRDNAKAMHLELPIKAALRVDYPANLDMLEAVPGIDYHDQRVDFVAADFGAAYDGIIAFIDISRAGYNDVTRDVIAMHPDGARIFADARDTLYTRWLEVESGRMSRPPEPTPPAGRRYHGVN